MQLGENHGPDAPRMFDNGAQESFEKYGGNVEHLAKNRSVAKLVFSQQYRDSKYGASISIP